ncbi:DksA/TraR family C4-type zinc finger protein [Neisseria weixii]|uniref:DksA/TraR family C4-type zinc finger protein n=1 Tax=Neisseria weixii TaxID=1853276 RepID=UPI0035A04F93
MAGGWAPDGAEQAQIDASLDDALAFARRHLPSGKSAYECTECGESIPEARRCALPGVKMCVSCQKKQISSNFSMLHTTVAAAKTAS